MLYLFAELLVGFLSGMVLGFTHQLWRFGTPLGLVAGGVLLSFICVFLTLFFSFILTAGMFGYVVSLLGVTISYFVMTRYLSFG